MKPDVSPPEHMKPEAFLAILATSALMVGVLGFEIATSGIVVFFVMYSVSHEVQVQKYRREMARRGRADR